MMTAEERKQYDAARRIERVAKQRQKRQLASIQRKSQLKPITDPFSASQNGGAGRLHPGEAPAPTESDEARRARWNAEKAKDEAQARYAQAVEDSLRRTDPVAWAEWKVMMKQSQPGMLADLDKEYDLDYAHGEFHDEAGTLQGDPDFQKFLDAALRLNAQEQVCQ